MHRDPSARGSHPPFALLIARRYRNYRMLALIVACLLMPATCCSAFMINQPNFVVIFVALFLLCASSIGLAVRWRRRAKNAEIGAEAERVAVDLLRNVFPSFVCEENVKYRFGDIDIVLSNETCGVVLAVEVKAYRRVDNRIHKAIEQSRRAAYAIKERFQQKGTPAYVIDQIQNVERVRHHATIIVPLVFLPLSQDVPNDRFVVTYSSVGALPSLVDYLRSSHNRKQW